MLMTMQAYDVLTDICRRDYSDVTEICLTRHCRHILKTNVVLSLSTYCDLACTRRDIVYDSGSVGLIGEEFSEELDIQ